jgi:hypothetical protein
MKILAMTTGAAATLLASCLGPARQKQNILEMATATAAPGSAPPAKR